jgi:4-methylaminobutanoate oxidase (formaldehyde-forming)
LEFLIDWNKGDFVGARALADIRQNGVKQKLVCLILNDALPVFGGEAIFHGDKVVAQATSGNRGYSIDSCLVLAYLPVELLEQSDFAVEAFGKRSSATLIKGAAYDPGREKILC